MAGRLNSARGGSRSSGRRSGGSGRSGLMSDINVVPYIDVMLVLLVIFMATAPLLPPGTIDLPKLGKSNNRPDAFVEVQIGSKGDIVVRAVNSASPQSDIRSSNADLAQAIKKLRTAMVASGSSVNGGSVNGGSANDIPVVISADKSVRYDIVMQAMDQLQKENVSRVGLMVKKQ